MAESLSLAPTLDPDSPYYLDPNFESDFSIPTVILSQAEDNYVYWKLRFQHYFRCTNKTGFIDGTLGKPDPSSPLYRPWKQCNSKVMFWLMNSMTENLLNLVMHAKTAHKMWEDLRLIFVPSLDLKIFELRRRIATMRQNGDSVATYFRKFCKAWMELSEYDPLPKCKCSCCSCEIAKRAKEARDKEERYTFLMGLNNDLSILRTQIMLMKPPPSLRQASLIVEQAESMMKTTRPRRA